MGLSAKEVEEALLALTRKERAAVIRRGLQTLENRQPKAARGEIDAAWRVELRKRIDDIESGRVETVSIDASFAAARAAISSLGQ